MRKTYFYLETDGQVFLIRQGTRWQFPTRRSQLPCRFTALFKIPLKEGDVVFGKPHLKRHPFHWFHKDEVIGSPKVAPIVQQAINRSLPRAAAKVVIIEKGRVLMVKAARGLTKGYWNLPGGFVGYGEHPEWTVQRECEEELGVGVKLIRLLGTFTEVFPRTGGYMISFVYLGKLRTRTLKLHPEEMEAAEWMPIQKALRITRNPFAKAGLRAYLKKPRQR